MGEFGELDIPDRKAEKLSDHFDSLMDLASSGRWDVNEAIEISDDKYAEMMKQAKELALDNQGGFQKTDSYESKEAEIQDDKIPVKGIRDVDAFRTWLSSDRDLSTSTVHKYRNALRRFYYYTSQKHDRKTQINLDDRDKRDELKEQLENFVVSRSSELGMKKYMGFYAENNPDEKEKAEEMKEFIHNVAYEPEDELEVSING